MALLCSDRSLDRFFSGSFLVLFLFFSVPSASSVSSVLISCLFFQLSTFNFRLSIFLVNLPDPATLIKNQIKHLMLPHQNLPKLLFLHQRHRLQLHHLQHRQERYNHRVPRRTRLKKLNQIYRIIRARKAAIICATVNSSCRNSIRETSFFRSKTCWNTFTKSTSETTSSPSVPSSLESDLSGFDQTLSSICCFWYKNCAAF